MGAHVAFSLSSLFRKLFTGADGQSRLAPNEVLQWIIQRESTDMPKEWAQRLVIAPANDLHVGYFPQEAPSPVRSKGPHEGRKVFGRMVSRGDAETTKYKRLT